MSLGERLLRYAEAVITLSRALEDTREHIRTIREDVLQNRERIIRLEERVEALLRELDMRDQKLAADLSRQIHDRLPPPKKR